MDEFAKLPKGERRIYFEQAAALSNLTAQLVEKDFWVCWSLRRLFSLDEFRDHLTFKGGTSLSKVHQLIKRFSEDIDVAIERVFLGFGGEMDPEKGESGKEKKRRLKQLGIACQTKIKDQLQPQLQEAISVVLDGAADWNLTLDPLDPDQQTLIFQYPPAIEDKSSYIPASVKIEFGARSDHFPVENNATVTSPYLATVIPDALTSTQTQVRVLAARRTFWEKATILHMLFHRPKDKSIQPRMSRHYYDIYCMSQGPRSVCEQAMNDMKLLDRVAEHKSVFFAQKWAKYDQARPGTLRLSPRQNSVDALIQDYKDMEPMFFGTVLPFTQILTHLAEMENRINGR